MDDEQDLSATSPQRRSVEDVLAEIRATVSAEAHTRDGHGLAPLYLDAAYKSDDPAPLPVLKLTADMQAQTSLPPRLVIDENELRRMIGQIVRDELRGALGEEVVGAIARSVGANLSDRTQQD